MTRATATRLGLLLVVIVVMGGLAYAANRSVDEGAKSSQGTAAPGATAQSGLPIENVKIQGTEFALEVAANEKDIAKGLGKRNEIPPMTGMIFVFSAGNDRSFWMIDCLIDMDIAYLAPDGTVLTIYTMKKEAPRGEKESQYEYEGRLKRYLSGPGAQFAIETPAGTNDALKIKPGVKIPLDRRSLMTHLRVRNSAAVRNAPTPPATPPAAPTPPAPR